MMRLNKIMLSACVIGIANIANAAMYVPPPSTTPSETNTGNKGIYVGIGVGGISLDAETNGAGNITTDGVLTDTSNSVNAGNQGVNGSIFGGYAWTFSNKLFLAGEIFGTLTNVPVDAVGNSNTDTDPSLNQATDTTDVSMRLKGTYGVRLLPGYQVTQSTVVYGLVGYSRADIDSSATHTLSVTPAGGDTTSFESSNSDSNWFNGLQLGVGSMVKVAEHVALRGDIIWTGYQSQTIQSGGVSNADGSSAGSISATPTTLEGNVSLVYMFD